ncbi:uncharacterized protein LOC115816193 [Chanos chanos]|uniref:Uncharacterized protein LOC115816193 n=1 Tax=Chanos chanos TaxID=29144 RepID=A0A6J2VV08_CHACN|nr:uncharacterized protein LOC115816193 [Chanos chanos]
MEIELGTTHAHTYGVGFVTPEGNPRWPQSMEFPRAVRRVTRQPSPLRIFTFDSLLFQPDGANAQVQSLPQTNVVVSVEVGNDVTLSCSCQTEMAMHYSWYKHVWGQKPQLISTIYKYDTQAMFYNEFEDNPRFTVQRGVDINHLRISEVQSEDVATYYCGGAHSNVIEFDVGIDLIVKEAKTEGFVVQQNSASQLVKPGANVTLQCTIHPMGESCAGQHHVYWFRQNPEQSYPGIIYTYENSSDQCERSCVYNLPKRNIGLSDAGTYYCAVVTCGKILVGNGTRVDTQDTGMHHSV